MESRIDIIKSVTFTLKGEDVEALWSLLDVTKDVLMAKARRTTGKTTETALSPMETRAISTIDQLERLTERFTVVH